MNESFSSTTLRDALFVGSEVMRQILDLELLGVFVTFVDELASLGESTVSMVSQVVPENPGGADVSRWCASRPTASPTPRRSPRSTASPTRR